jgi:uncharacterized membrane protein YeaQ/YmgE (transglycosylase-associated protein family)
MKAPSAAPTPVPDVPVWNPWPINWSAIWVGTLTALAAAVVLGLIGTALGATSARSLSWSAVTRLDVAVAVFCAFLAFVAGGWTTVKVAGIPYAEPAILHAVVAWLVALPLLLVLLSLGGASAFGGWYGGIVGPSSLSPETATIDAAAVRSTALASLTAVLLGLIGSVIGGWIASGEPMSFTHHLTRSAVWSDPKRRMPS